LNLINTLQSALDYGRQTIGTHQVLDEAGFLRDAPDMAPVGEGWGLLRMPPIPQLLDEFGSYELDDKDLQQDCVMAVALAVGSVYDGSVLDRPLTGGLYGGSSEGYAPDGSPLVLCDNCMRPKLEMDISLWRTTSGGQSKYCSKCVDELALVIDSA
jgi:hypothetical protein